MSEDERPIRHSKPLRVVGYITEDGPQLEVVEHGKVTLAEIDAFMLCLPREYRQLAIFVRVTAADPEVAVTLEVDSVNRLFAELGPLGAMEKLSNVPTHPDLELLLPIQIKGRRAALLKRKKVPAGEEPPQVYLNRNARPITLKKANAAFARISERMNFPIPITLETIARAVIRDFMNRVAGTKRHPVASLLKHYLKEVPYGATPLAGDVSRTRH